LRREDRDITAKAHDALRRSLTAVVAPITLPAVEPGDVGGE